MKVLDNITGKRILITGGTGFIGGRLVEILKTEYDVNVRVMVSNFANIARIARFKIDMLQGDICNNSEVERAVDGCDYVFHCAYGNKGSKEDRRRINVQGTENVLSACLKYDVKRIVHLSTVMVYGDTPDTEIDETYPTKPSGGLYSDTKLEAEKLINEYYERDNLSAAILQPTAVYGPYAPVWGKDTIDKLRTGKVLLINGGEGLCNGVYIDDLISAMLLAAVNNEADGNKFIISGDQPITWKKYYSYYESMLGKAATIEMSEADAIACMGRLRTRKSLFKLLREDTVIRAKLFETPLISNFRKAAIKILPEPALHIINKKIKGNINGKGQSKDVVEKQKKMNGFDNKLIHLMSKKDIQFFKSRTHFKTDKAKNILGYTPRYDFELGMKITGLWADSANLLGNTDSISTHPQKNIFHTDQGTGNKNDEV
ncbi:MAG: NAD-dependent epimerase/dehydratase family protein [Balneolales bacterium]